jgi:putative flippase GtrA
MVVNQLIENDYRRVLFGEIKRFVLCGLTTLVVCLTTMWLLVDGAGLNKIVSLNLTAVVGFLYSYSINKVLVFRKNEHSHFVYGSRFLLLQVLLLLLNNGLFYIGVYLFEFQYLMVNFTSAVFLTIINFVIMKIVVFN